MKDIRLIQYEKVRDQYQKLIKLASRQFSMSDVEELRSRILTSTSELPMGGNYRVQNNQPVDVKSINAEISLIKSDIESVFDYLSSIEYKKREIEYVIETHANYTSEKVKQANRDIMSLSSGKFINGITQEIPFNEYTDDKLTTAGMADDKLSLPVSEVIVPDHIFINDEVSIKRIGPDYKVEIIGSPLSILNPGKNEKLIMRLYPGKNDIYKPCGFKIDITAFLNEVNYMFLRMDESKVGMKVLMEIGDKNNTETIYNNVINSDTLDISFDRKNINRVIATFTMDIPNTSKDGETYYEWVLYSFRIMNSIREQQCQYVTKKIEISNDIDYIQLVKEDETLGKSSIKYFLTTKIDNTGKPTAFSELTSEDETFTLSSQKQTLKLEPKNNIWNITRDISKGRRLYNILECIYDIDYGNIKIISGEIQTENNIEIIKDGIRLYNGIGNYIIDNIDEGSDFASDIISYKSVYNSTTEWVTPIPLRINIDREPIENTIFNNGITTINLLYPMVLENQDYLKLYDADNRIFLNQIISAEPQQITLSGEINTSNKLYVDYITNLSLFMKGNKNVEIDYNSITVSVENEEYILNTDFIVNTSNDIYSVELLKTGNYINVLDIVQDSEYKIYNESPNINIKYKFKAYGINNDRIFKTNINCNRYTDITIIPFTPEEIAAGNYHIINGINVSTERKYTMKPGWNTVKTSQPYPTLNGNIFDVNQYTNKMCPAGIIIPDDVDTVRPYKDSMKQISPFMLSISNKDEKECFSYDNGKIYINYIPEYIDPNIINDPYYGNITGERFLCREATYGIDLKNTEYKPIPENFILELKYKDIGEDRNIYVKIELSSAGTTGNARVFRLGLNKFKED